jgi:hypothetical protein
MYLDQVVGTVKMVREPSSCFRFCCGRDDLVSARITKATAVTYFGNAHGTTDFGLSQGTAKVYSDPQLAITALLVTYPATPE